MADPLIMRREVIAVEVHLYGKLRRFTSNPDPFVESVVFVEQAENDRIEDVIRRIGIPLAEVGSNIFLNGEYSGLRRRVKDGDRLGIFPDDMQLLYKWYYTKIEE